MTERELVFGRMHKTNVQKKNYKNYKSFLR